MKEESRYEESGRWKLEINAASYKEITEQDGTRRTACGKQW